MTIPRMKRVRDAVVETIPFLRDRLTKAERDLAVHMRGNESLYSALASVINARIEGRARLSEPSDPVQCKSIVARDSEARAIIRRLELVYRAPLLEPAETEGEPPS